MITNDKRRAEILVQLSEDFIKYFNAVLEGEEYCGKVGTATLWHELENSLQDAYWIK